MNALPHLLSNNLSDWLTGIEHLHPRNIEMGLDRVRIVKERLGIHFKCPVITVGGTNGKGSTCTMMKSIWQQAGYCVGLYTSPHIHHFEERLLIDGKTVSESTFIKHFRAVEKARGEIRLTFFEFTTLTIMQILAAADPDVVILEVGLGGRLDAVNLIDATVSVITNIDIDHVDYLGDTRELIGYEKAGILRSNQIAVYGDIDPPRSLVRYVNELGTDLRVFGRDFHSVYSGKLWNYAGKDLHFDHLQPPALYGRNQIRNATVALMVLEVMRKELPIDEKAVRTGLARAHLPGRFQILQNDPLVIVDAAHNPHAAVVLADNLRSLGAFHATHAVFGAMADKDIDGVIALMKGEIDYWYLADLPVARAASAEMLKDRLVAAGVSPDRISLFQKVTGALAAAKINSRKDDKIIAFGSFWIVTGVTQTENSDSLT